MKTLAVLLVFLVVSNEAVSAEPQRGFGFEFFSGNDLYGRCTPGAKYNLSDCWRYVEGAVDMAMFAERSLQRQQICLPVPASSVSGEQISDVVVKYLRDEPRERSATAASLVYDALHKAFPCPAMPTSEPAR